MRAKHPQSITSPRLLNTSHPEMPPKALSTCALPEPHHSQGFQRKRWDLQKSKGQRWDPETRAAFGVRKPDPRQVEQLPSPHSRSGWDSLTRTPPAQVASGPCPPLRLLLLLHPPKAPEPTLSPTARVEPPNKPPPKFSPRSPAAPQN